MSCIAGVGGGVPGLVKTARSGRRILALDGCVLACARACLAREGITPDEHVVLGDHGVKKRKHADFDPQQAEDLYQRQVLPAAARLRDTPAARECGIRAIPYTRRHARKAHCLSTPRLTWVKVRTRPHGSKIPPCHWPGSP